MEYLVSGDGDEPEEVSESSSNSRSKNYAPRQLASESTFGFLVVLMGKRPKTFDDYLHYRCGDCGCYFRVRVV